jgi:hypothetical protein
MAVLPTAVDLGRRPTPRPQAQDVQISQTALAAPGRAAAALGNEMTSIGDEMLDRWSSAVARERDAMVSDRIRDLMYGDNGYMNRQGANAIGQHGSLEQALEAIRNEALQGINNTTRERLEPSIQSRIDAALGNVMRHGASELRTYEQQASLARRTSLIEDAVADPDRFATSLEGLRSETLAEAARLGISTTGSAPTGPRVVDPTNPEFFDEPELSPADLLWRERSEPLFRAEAARLAADNPIEAMEFIDEYEDDMGPVLAMEMRQTLRPEVERYQGRQAARTQSGLLQQPTSAPVTRITFAGRPAENPDRFAPNPYLQRAIASAIDDATRDGVLDPRWADRHQLRRTPGRPALPRRPVQRCSRLGFSARRRLIHSGRRPGSADHRDLPRALRHRGLRTRRPLPYG